MLKYEKDIVVVNDGGIYATSIDLGNHQLTGDEPLKAGGKDLGPASHQFLLTALGNCMAITARMYAQRKQWDSKKISVHLNIEKVKENGDETTVIHRKVFLEGDLTEEQRNRILVIADRCPIHQLLTGKIEIK
ncbi:MAG: OsmC family protein [Bacteroidota bacterium]